MANRALRTPRSALWERRKSRCGFPPPRGIFGHARAEFTPRIRRRVAAEGATGSEGAGSCEPHTRHVERETQAVFSKSPRARGVSTTSPGNAIWPRVIRAILPPRRPSRRTISASRVGTARTRHHLARSCGYVMRFTPSPEVTCGLGNPEDREKENRARASQEGGLSLSLFLFSPPPHM